MTKHSTWETMTSRITCKVLCPRFIVWISFANSKTFFPPAFLFPSLLRIIVVKIIKNTILQREGQSIAESSSPRWWNVLQRRGSPCRWVGSIGPSNKFFFPLFSTLNVWFLDNQNWTTIDIYLSHRTYYFIRGSIIRTFHFRERD